MSEKTSDLPKLTPQQQADLDFALARQERLGRLTTNDGSSVEGEEEAAKTGVQSAANDSSNISVLDQIAETTIKKATEFYPRQQLPDRSEILRRAREADQATTGGPLIKESKPQTKKTFLQKLFRE